MLTDLALSELRPTGCRVLWVAHIDRTPRLATLYFEGGELRRDRA
jgi:hypothetical protein